MAVPVCGLSVHDIPLPKSSVGLMSFFVFLLFAGLGGTDSKLIPEAVVGLRGKDIVQVCHPIPTTTHPTAVTN